MVMGSKLWYYCGLCGESRFQGRLLLERTLAEKTVLVVTGIGGEEMSQKG